MFGQQLCGGAADCPVGGPYLTDEVVDETLDRADGVRGSAERSDQHLRQRGDRDDQASAAGQVAFQRREGGLMVGVVGVPQGQEYPAVDDYGGSHLLRCSCSLVAAVMPGIAPAYLPSRSVTGVITIRPSRRTWTCTRSPGASPACASSSLGRPSLRRFSISRSASYRVVLGLSAGTVQRARAHAGDSGPHPALPNPGGVGASGS